MGICKVLFILSHIDRFEMQATPRTWKFLLMENFYWPSFCQFADPWCSGKNGWWVLAVSIGLLGVAARFVKASARCKPLWVPKFGHNKLGTDASLWLWLWMGETNIYGACHHSFWRLGIHIVKPKWWWEFDTVLGLEIWPHENFCKNGYSHLMSSHDLCT